MKIAISSIISNETYNGIEKTKISINFFSTSAMLIKLNELKLENSSLPSYLTFFQKKKKKQPLDLHFLANPATLF